MNCKNKKAMLDLKHAVFSLFKNKYIISNIKDTDNVYTRLSPIEKKTVSRMYSDLLELK